MSGVLFACGTRMEAKWLVEEGDLVGLVAAILFGELNEPSPRLPVHGFTAPPRHCSDCSVVWVHRRTCWSCGADGAQWSGA